MAETPTPALFDVVILGGGSGGYACALRASQLGLTVALIEKGKLGGTCLHNGCIPTKALLHSAEVADMARESAKVGVKTKFQGIEIAEVNKYKDSVVKRLYKGLQGLVKSRDITYISGMGQVTGPQTVTVDGRVVQGRNLVLATGSYPRTLPGLEIGGRIMTSDQALEMDWIPESAIILGGGVIGVEFASVWRSFGVDVTVVEGLANLIPNEDAAASKAMERAFRKRKIKSKLGVRFASAVQDGSGVTVTLEDGAELRAEILLVAIGRGPNSADMGFEEAGVTVDRGWVPVDERLQTNLSNTYAVGDVVPGLQLAHRGFAQGIFVAEEIAGLAPDVIEEIGIPRVTYSHPEVASVGYTQAQAEDKFGKDNVTTYEYNLGGNGKSQILGTAGFVKLVEVTDGPIVGLHLVGDRVGEQIGEAQLIYNWEATAVDVAKLIHAHPTQNEAVGEAHLALAGKPLHAHA
ncbi:dihydrolipoyl dehydrogenase [Candidatus Nanopelagicales bacterium]|nr:dihydrolipoyl dehydrogenase [Candidatus Nanopelagicales bacterium]